MTEFVRLFKTRIALNKNSDHATVNLNLHIFA